MTTGTFGMNVVVTICITPCACLANPVSNQYKFYNLRPLCQWADATPSISMEEPVVIGLRNVDIC